MKIKLLSDTTISKIASGEVIQRPVSVVKELVENSIDANARNINITINKGGKNLISVSDDGDGIYQEDLELSIKRYTTSKLLHENIANISYMGFRGEALASIAAAAELSITTKVRNHIAWNLTSINNVINIIPTSSNYGTTVNVYNLFCYIPNKVRFLKSESSEMLACRQMIEAFAIAHSNIKFTFSHNKYTINFNDNALKQILGEYFVQNAIQFNNQQDEIKIYGYLLPECNRIAKSHSFIFVNKRPMKDPFLNKLVKIAYFNILPKNTKPNIVLFIEAPSHFIDINVHSCKTEVRFYNENLVRDIIINTLRNTIQSNNGGIDNNRHDNNTIQKCIQTSMFAHNSCTIPILQIANKYVIAQRDDDSLIIIDQHAAHERIILETINKTAYEVEKLLIPIKHDFGQYENEIIISISPKLSIYGINISLVDDQIAIHSIPLIPGNLDIIALLEDILCNKELAQDMFDIYLDEILKKIACYSSIRAGKKLTIYEMQNLIALLNSTMLSKQCIHGRPTYIEFNINTLDKLFERK